MHLHVNSPSYDISASQGGSVLLLDGEAIVPVIRRLLGLADHGDWLANMSIQHDTRLELIMLYASVYEDDIYKGSSIMFCGSVLQHTEPSAAPDVECSALRHE